MCPSKRSIAGTASSDFDKICAKVAVAGAIATIANTCAVVDSSASLCDFFGVGAKVTVAGFFATDSSAFSI